MHEKAETLIEKKIAAVRYEQAALDQLLDFSGFPEPFLKADGKFLLRWRRAVIDRLVREDIRDLTRIISLENVETLIQLLPERIGSPLSLNSLKVDMMVSHSAVRNAISALRLTYLIFLIPPYSQKIARSIKKEKKCYFYDWTMCKGLAQRFENYVALELKIMTELWNDEGIAVFDLFYLRQRNSRETDFLITRESIPWCLFEVKLKDSSINSHHYGHSEALGNIPLVQVAHENGILKKNDRFYRISASRFFT